MRKLLIPVKQLFFALFFQALLSGCNASLLSSNQKTSVEISRIADAVTVKIDGVKQGSGVLIDKVEDEYEALTRYVVLTAWHVVKDVNPGEELFIHTYAGGKYKVIPESVVQVGNVDMGLISFVSSKNYYDVASIGDEGSVGSGSVVYVSGFPLPTSAVPERLGRFLEGKIIAYAKTPLPGGYRLLYSNPTLPGMSGGPVFSGDGNVVAIHGQAELSAHMTEQTGLAVKSGSNQGIPIADHVNAAIIYSSLDNSGVGYRQEVLSAGLDSSSDAASGTPLKSEFYYSAVASEALAHGNYSVAIDNYSMSISIDPSNHSYYRNRGEAFMLNEQYDRSLKDLNTAVGMEPDEHNIVSRAVVYQALDRHEDAIDDLTSAIKLNPNYSYYSLRGFSYLKVGANVMAIDDFSKSLKLGLQASPDAWDHANRGIAYEAIGELGLACRDWRQASNLGHSDASKWVADQC